MPGVEGSAFLFLNRERILRLRRLLAASLRMTCFLVLGLFDGAGEEGQVIPAGNDEEEWAV